MTTTMMSDDLSATPPTAKSDAETTGSPPPTPAADPQRLASDVRDSTRLVTDARRELSQRRMAVDPHSQSSLLVLENLHVYYGNIHALKGVSLHVDQGEIVTIIGCNGAGKSTTLKTISGLLRPRRGDVLHKRELISTMPAENIVSRGIVQSPEGRRIFANLTVNENLDMGAYLRRDKAAIERDRETVFTLFPRLKERRRQRAGTMSGGEQQMLAIGRALMSDPQLLLLDEPSLGLAPVLVQQIFEVIVKLNRERNLTILVVEQNAAIALRIAHRAYVLETGFVTMHGPASELAANPAVQQAYLGG